MLKIPISQTLWSGEGLRICFVTKQVILIALELLQLEMGDIQGDHDLVWHQNLNCKLCKFCAGHYHAVLIAGYFTSLKIPLRYNPSNSLLIEAPVPRAPCYSLWGLTVYLAGVAGHGVTPQLKL